MRGIMDGRGMNVRNEYAKRGENREKQKKRYNGRKKIRIEDWKHIDNKNGEIKNDNIMGEKSA